MTFDVLGDTGENLSNTGVAYPNLLNVGEQSIYQEIGQSGAQFLLMAGDVAYNGGTETTYGDLAQTGVDVSDIFGPSYLPQADGLPTFVADGNHGQTSDDLEDLARAEDGCRQQRRLQLRPATGPGGRDHHELPSDWSIQDGRCASTFSTPPGPTLRLAPPPVRPAPPSPAIACSTRRITTSTGRPPRPSTSGSRPTWRHIRAG